MNLLFFGKALLGMGCVSWGRFMAIGMDMVSFSTFRILKNDGGLRKDDEMVENPWTQMKKRAFGSLLCR
jgi:hypothetical protein